MSNLVPRAARGFSKTSYLVTAATALMLAACSSSVERFAQNPSDADPVYTASVPKKKAASYDDESDGQIASKPLANASTKPLYNYGSNYRAPATKQPAYKAPQVAVDETPTVPSGGTVTITEGMTLYSIAKANRITVAELAAANGLKAPYAVHQGQTLRIPGKAEAMAPSATKHKQATATAKPVKQSAGGVHEVASGDTLFSLGRKYGVSPYAIADANGLKHSATLQLGQSLKIPAGGTGKIVAKQAAPTLAEPADETVASGTETPGGQDSAQPAKKPAVAEQVPAPDNAGQQEQQQASAETPQPAAPADSSAMRWPVRGKIISGFGAKPNGLKNEGINIAVPEGTSVRAAEGGVVAYAGNELKGYGNLVLIRHEGGWVTAYAHAKELFVKRGDTVKRGDVIAKAGQTGSVSSPQLHFEVRKGAVAMDPLKFLSSSTASN